MSVAKNTLFFGLGDENMIWGDFMLVACLLSHDSDEA